MLTRKGERMKCAICGEDFTAAGINVVSGEMVWHSDTKIYLEIECHNCDSTCRIEAELDKGTEVWS